MKSEELEQGDVYQYKDDDLNIICIYDKYQTLFLHDVWPYEFKIISTNSETMKQDILYLSEVDLVKLIKLS